MRQERAPWYLLGYIDAMVDEASNEALVLLARSEPVVARPPAGIFKS